MAIYNYQINNKKKPIGLSGRVKDIGINGIAPDEQPIFDARDEVKRAKMALESTQTPLMTPSPVQETQAPVIEPQKKEGWLSKLFQQPSDVEQKAGEVSKARRAAEYVLPTLFSIFGGAGAIPGIATGMGIGVRRKGEARAYQSIENKEAEKLNQQYRKEALDLEKLNETKAYHQARSNALANQSLKPNATEGKLSDDRAYQNAYQQLQYNLAKDANGISKLDAITQKVQNNINKGITPDQKDLDFISSHKKLQMKVNAYERSHKIRDY